MKKRKSKKGREGREKRKTEARRKRDGRGIKKIGQVQPEGSTTRIYNYVFGGFWGEEEEERLAIDVNSGPIF